MSRRSGLFFVAPALVLFGVFVLYPMASALSYAFFSWQGTTRGAFVGLENFVALFTQEPFITRLPRAFGHNIAGLTTFFGEYATSTACCSQPQWPARLWQRRGGDAEPAGTISVRVVAT